MAQYRLHANPISRGAGRSSVAAAAYRAGAKLTDERTGEIHDYTRKRGVLHSEILTPRKAPSWMRDRAKLWNAVEVAEDKSRRAATAQLSREIQLSLPHELSEGQNRAMVLDFVKSQFVKRGMVADVAIHAPDSRGDERNFHAHVMLTTREVSNDGFADKKNRSWNSKALFNSWREQWAVCQNREFERLGLAVRVDHRSYEDQGIDREPTQHLGPVANDMEKKNKGSSRIGAENMERQQRNAERAAEVQKTADATRQIAEEKARQAEAVNVRRAELDSQLRHDEIELTQRHDRAMQRLVDDQNARNQQRQNELATQARALQQELRAEGWRKLMRDFIGKTRRDRDALDAVRKNQADMTRRADEERAALVSRQAQERAEFEQQRNSRQLDFERRLEQDRSAAIEKTREATRPIERETPVNDLRPPDWQRTAAREQQNSSPTRPTFEKAAQNAPERQDGASQSDRDKAADLFRQARAKGRERDKGGREPD